MAHETRHPTPADLDAARQKLPQMLARLLAAAGRSRNLLARKAELAPNSAEATAWELLNSAVTETEATLHQAGRDLIEAVTPPPPPPTSAPPLFGDAGAADAGDPSPSQ